MENTETTDRQDGAEPERTAMHMMRVISEIETFIREKRGMRVLIEDDSDISIGAYGAGYLKATFSIVPV